MTRCTSFKEKAKQL